MKPIRTAAKAPVKFYRRFISPGLPPRCRFEPSCSAYAIEAIDEWGAFRGWALAIWRVLRCNPFGGSGYDPVPINHRKRATVNKRKMRLDINEPQNT